MSLLFPQLEISTESIFGSHGVGDGEGLPLPRIQVPANILRLLCQMSDIELTSRGSSQDHIRTTQTPDDRFWFASLYDLILL